MRPLHFTEPMPQVPPYGRKHGFQRGRNAAARCHECFWGCLAALGGVIENRRSEPLCDDAEPFNGAIQGPVLETDIAIKVAVFDRFEDLRVIDFAS